ncbi:DUF4292 domain-containing protein [Flavobacterium sp. NG2]|uniref:DUF4292 domain-containing protein n=1 Tax=Flavobacterium sp. NG2 TaxID=3097547 RepID=UPI002A82E828|nr:DUF4292 domain-containing protein [Flavobacterium sp. NG2]WPR72211.1 DUF4292 domain-containing protein [Flavobacterium sp. NG2]
MTTTSFFKRNFFVLTLVSSLALVSCKSKQTFVQNVDSEAVIGLKTNAVIEKLYANKADFKTVYIKSDASFDNGNQSQNVTAEIRIKKDEQILVSIRFLGITMAKASITPKTVSYYEKIKGTYFEGDFSTLSQWLGTDLNYDKIQNMLMGESLDDLKKGKYNQTMAEQLYRLDDKANNSTQKTFYIDAANFKIKKQEVAQTDKARKIQIEYANFSLFNALIMPTNVQIHAIQEKGKTEINLDYTSVSFNEELSFPYSVPNGYKRILIN